MAKRSKPKSLLAQRLKRLTPCPIKAFAKKLGVEPARYYAWLAGERPPDDTLAEIARMLHISLDDLLGDEPDERVSWRPPRILALGYQTIHREDLPADWRGRYVPVIGAIAAGPPRDTVEAEAFAPGDASEYVAFRDAPPEAIAVRVVGHSMSPDYLPNDIVVADLATPVAAGVAVVVYLDDTGDRVARLKSIRRAGAEVILESINPAGGRTRLPAARVLRAGRIVARLPLIMQT